MMTPAALSFALLEAFFERGHVRVTGRCRSNTQRGMAGGRAAPHFYQELVPGFQRTGVNKLKRGTAVYLSR
jgi:hypothetical protein